METIFKSSLIIPAYANLYKINSNNKLYCWNIEIVKVPNSDSYEIITRNGEKGGKMVTHSTIIEKGKASRTTLEQAILEANAKFKNKKEKELYTEDASSLTSSIEDTKKSGGKKTVSNKMVRPMLAQEFDFSKYEKTGNSRSFKISFPAFIQRKYDGIRCLAYVRNGVVVLESRTGEPFEKFDILRNQILELYSKMSVEMRDNFYFDGELYTNDIPFNEISGLVRMTVKHAKVADIEKANKIHYYIYDCINLQNLEMTCKERNDFMTHYFGLFKKNEANNINMIHRVETEIAESHIDVKTKHDAYVGQGYEGIMIRDMSGCYEVDKRSKYLQKYKEFNEAEFKIIGFHEENGGLVIWDVLLPNGKTCACAPNASDTQRKEMFKNGASYIGKMLTVYYFGEDADGRLRFPRGKAIREGY
jgi:ATP-dependent DNA ligase